MRTENFCPVYNNFEQVKRCVEPMLGETVKSVEIGIVIAFNGEEFVTSTDWRITTENGLEQILPFSIQTQYPSFLECKAGVLYDQFQGNILVLPDGKGVKKGKVVVFDEELDNFRNCEALIVDTKNVTKDAVVILDGCTYNFEAGEKLLIKINPEDKFLVTDCLVTCEEFDKVRVYTVNTEGATYGVIQDGRVSKF